MAVDEVFIRYQHNLKQLEQEVDQYARNLEGVERTTDNLAKNTKKGMDDAGRSISNVTQKTDGLGAIAKKATGFIASMFAIEKVMAFGSAIVRNTATVQKFEAVLTNALGSNSKARQALASLQEFAAKTPFQLEELTGSFVKLVNRGFKPTQDEMRKIGDLAASQGK